MGATRQSWLLGVFAAAVVVALLVLVWKLRASQRPDARASSEEQAGATSGGAGSAARPRRGLLGTPVTGDGAGPRYDPPPVVPVADLLVEAEQQLRAEARRCQLRDDTAIDAQHLTVHYNLVFREQRAHVENVVVIESDLTDQHLKACLIERIGGTSWEATGAADSVRTLQLSLRMADLREPAGGE